MTDVTRMARLLPRFAAVLLALVGVVALGIGGVLLASHRWPAADATVRSCTPHTTRSGGSTRTDWDCLVDWQDSAGTHTATLSLGSAAPGAGQSVRVRYHGSVTVQETPAWGGYAALGVGLVLVAAGVLVLLRSRRRT